MKRMLAVAVLLGITGAVGSTLSVYAQKSPPPGKFAVTAVGLKPNQPSFSGQCPTTVTFRGYITTNGPGRVEYSFARSDVSLAQVQTLDFKDAGTQEVSTEWSLTNSFEGWLALKVQSPNIIESNHATGSFRVSCEGRTFRVTMLGFVVNHQTLDTALETDGKGDEIYQAPVVFLYDRERGLETRAFRVSGPVFGDVNNHPTYIQAGQISEDGGLGTGDGYPHARPWQTRVPTRPGYGFPSILFEGDLRPAQNAAVIIPSLWEHDGELDLFNAYMDSVGRAVPAITRTVAGLVGDGSVITFTSRPGELFGLASPVWLDQRLVDLRDRPIGMQRPPGGSPNLFIFQPSVLVLTYESARAAITSDNGFGPGVIEVRYDDNPQLEGSYSIFVQVEQVR